MLVVKMKVSDFEDAPSTLKAYLMCRAFTEILHERIPWVKTRIVWSGNNPNYSRPDTEERWDRE